MWPYCQQKYEFCWTRGNVEDRSWVFMTSSEIWGPTISRSRHAPCRHTFKGRASLFPTSVLLDLHQPQWPGLWVEGREGPPFLVSPSLDIRTVPTGCPSSVLIFVISLLLSESWSLDHFPLPYTPCGSLEQPFYITFPDFSEVGNQCLAILRLSHNQVR